MIPLDSSPEALALRAAYDDQIRSRPGSANGGTIERVGPLIRKVGVEGDGFVQYLGGVDGAEVDRLIADQVEYFAKLGAKFEWKYYSHDLPADLPERLTKAGLVPEEEECLLLGDVDELSSDVVLTEGIRLREVTSRADLERMQAMEEEVWGYSHAWLPDALTQAIADDDPATVIVAETDEDDSKVVCASWIRFHTGTEFASLWGGSTLPEWRGRGIYRAHVAYRRNLAAARGYRYLQVDASPDSRGILARLGLRPVAVTVPYIWKPVA
ncbi:GNAT family N-acetyltransferase [Kribbella sp. NBC_00709]|uniref:GNAT family N-acetyltransferase n=1 Tax=Kribbella sp. NBC_00709 TaxID=2975972 RepID=UPI002E2C58AA|nr:GNAT family N-acetyltransferase [Kribbella sp. NBC_00709]